MTPKPRRQRLQDVAAPRCYKDHRTACDGSCGKLMPGGWCLELYGAGRD